MNAEKEQLSAAQAVLEKEKAEEGLACMSVLQSLAMGLLIAEVVRMRPRT